MPMPSQDGANNIILLLLGMCMSTPGVAFN